ncbi:hypothetical protein KR76_00094 [Pimelobacter simplex]|uniref:Uncharacterized protein n=1 Tax=Nocardioides simplex TaxID=2045 RepID=A0A0C5XGZ1_NOCSI|nr:hypothetical protein KR76_00094 [Pimelobacter simplex]
MDEGCAHGLGGFLVEQQDSLPLCQRSGAPSELPALHGPGA